MTHAPFHDTSGGPHHPGTCGECDRKRGTAGVVVDSTPARATTPRNLDRESFERRRLRVYVAGPISTGNTYDNIHRGLVWGRQLLQDGLAPFIPHLDAYMLMTNETWSVYLEWDLEWVAVSEAVFRINGTSSGADLECVTARALGIPVFAEDNYPALLDYAELTGKRKEAV